MVRIPSNRQPTHPGEMLLKEFLEPMGITQQELAQKIHVPYEQIHELIKGYREISPGMSLRLAKFFGISPDFWLNLQLRWDLYQAQQTDAEILSQIEQWAF